MSKLSKVRTLEFSYLGSSNRKNLGLLGSWHQQIFWEDLCRTLMHAILACLLLFDFRTTFTHNKLIQINTIEIDKAYLLSLTLSAFIELDNGRLSKEIRDYHWDHGEFLRERYEFLFSWWQRKFAFESYLCNCTLWNRLASVDMKKYIQPKHVHSLESGKYMS